MEDSPSSNTVPSRGNPPAGGRMAVDTLWASLERVAEFHGIVLNRDELLAGLPLVDGRLTPEMLMKAAERAGFNVGLTKRPVKKIAVTTLPAILLLKGDRAGVLQQVDHGAGAAFTVPGDAESGRSCDLKREYSGFALLLRPRQAYSAGESVLLGGDRQGSNRFWFWGTIWRFKYEYVRLLPASLLINFFALGMPIFVMTVYDRVVPNNAEETLWVLASGIFLVFIFEFLMRLLRGHLVTRSGKRVDSILASALYEQIMALEMKARPASAGELANRAKAYESLREFFTSATLIALADVPFSLLIILLIFWLAGPIGWIPVAAAVAAILFGLMVQFPMRRAVRDSYMGGLRRQALIAESINGMESVKGGNAESALQRRMEVMVREASDVEVRAHWYSLLATSTTTFLIHMTSIGIIVGCVYLVHLGEITMGAMIACVMLAARGMAPLAMVAGLLTRLQQTLTALGGLNEVMKLPREHGGARKFVSRPTFDSRFSLGNVTMKYPGQAVAALTGVSLRIEPGERIGVIGKVGSGKSTLLRLLAKLYEPTEGEVLLDGLDIKQHHPTTVRRHIGYLPQNGAIFFGTLKENVLLGAPWMKDEQMIRALERAGLADFINRNPHGVQLQVGEQGVLLSGGQRQQIALARTLLSEPKMLLLDEPTANMDVGTERNFAKSIKSYLDEVPGRTLVLSTHKLNLLELVDRVIVLDDGRLVADGEKEAVLEKLRRNSEARAGEAGRADGAEVEADDDGEEARGAAMNGAEEEAKLGAMTKASRALRSTRAGGAGAAKE